MSPTDNERSLDNTVALIQSILEHAAYLRQVEMVGSEFDDEHAVRRMQLSAALATEAAAYSRWQFELTGNSFPFGYVDNEWERDEDFDEDDPRLEEPSFSASLVVVSTLALYDVEETDELFAAATESGEYEDVRTPGQPPSKGDLARAVIWALYSPNRSAGLNRRKANFAARTIGDGEEFEWDDVGDQLTQILPPDFTFCER